MTLKKSVLLLVGDQDGVLAEALKKLKDQKFCVARAGDLKAAMSFIETAPRLSLVVVDSNFAADDVNKALARLREAQPSVPMVWAPDKPKKSANEAVVVVNPNASVEEIHAAMVRAIREHFYPEPLIHELRRATASAFESFGTSVMPVETYLKSTPRLASDLTCLLTFMGPSIEGYLLVGGSADSIEAILDRILPNRDREETNGADMLGEIGNTVLGEFKRLVERHGITFQVSLPVVLDSGHVNLTSPIAGPSLGLEFECDEGVLHVECCLRRFDPDQLKQKVDVQEVPTGEIIFL